MGLIASLGEVKAQEGGNVEFLSNEYRDVLQNADKIQREFKGQPEALNTLFGIITDQYVDMHKFRGRDAKRHIPALMQILDRYDLERVKEFFEIPAM